MKSKREKLYIAYFFIFILLVFGFAFLIIKCRFSQTLTYEQSADSGNPKRQDVYMEVVNAKSWMDQGSKANQFDATIYNTTGHEMKNWSVTMFLPKNGIITDSWGIDVKDNPDGSITIKAADYNEGKIITRNDPITFGFILIPSNTDTITDFTLSAVPIYEIKGFAAYYVLMTVSFLLLLAVIGTISAGLAERSYKKRRERDKMIIIQSMKTFSNFIDTKDPYTKGHSARVAYYSRKIAAELNFSPDELDNIYYIALLHDVGKISIPSQILNKPGALSIEEREKINTHTIAGATMLKDFSAIESIAEGAKFHHERFDGKGYPSGIAGEEIPLIARIICVADSFDAMNSSRVYRKALPIEEIVEELKKCSGTQFDPTIVNVMLKLIEKNAFADIAEEMAAEY